MLSMLFRGVCNVLIFLCVVGVLHYVYNVMFVESEETSSAPATTRFLLVDGEELAYSETDNDAPVTVIFVGGLSAWNGTWERTIQELDKKTKDFNYIAIDLPPFGYSTPDPDRGYFRDQQAKRLAQFILIKNLQKVILVGHSYGAGPVTEYALQDTSRVQKLVLVDAVLNIGETKEISKFAPVQFGFLRTFIIGSLIHNDTFALSQLRNFVYVTDHIDATLLEVYTRYFNRVGVTDRLSQWLSDYVNDPLQYKSTDVQMYQKLTIPVRVIWGDKDTLTPLSGTEILMTSIPDIQLTVLPNVGHIPMIEDYEAFDTALYDALQE